MQAYEFKHGKTPLKKPKTTKLYHAAGSGASCEPGTTFTYKVSGDIFNSHCHQTQLMSPYMQFVRRNSQVCSVWAFAVSNSSQPEGAGCTQLAARLQFLPSTGQGQPNTQCKYQLTFQEALVHYRACRNLQHSAELGPACALYAVLHAELQRHLHC
jgi:hypothetical protein